MAKKKIKKIKSIFLASSVLILCLQSFTAIVSAQLSPSQISVLQEGALYFNTCGGSSSSEETASSTGTGLSSGSNVYILGDSITERTESTYQSAFQAKGITANIDASSGRSLNGGGTDGNMLSGMAAISADKAEIQQANAVVIALGTNGGDTDSSIDAAIAAVKAINSNATLYWVDTIGVDGANFTPSVMDQTNAAIYGEASKDGYTVISWFSVVDPGANPQTATTTSDPNGYIDNSDGLGVHPTSAGETALANAVVSAVTGGSSGNAGSGSTCCGSGSSSSSASTTSVPTGNANQNAQSIFNFFVANGFTAAQAAGIDGNADEESAGTFSPTEQQIGGGGGYGIFQFTDSQLTEMESWTTAKGEDPNSLQGQLDYILYDITQGDSSGTAPAVKATDTPAAAADAFEENYERAGDPALSEREQDAEQLFQQYGGEAGSASTSTSTASSSSDCGSSSSGADCTNNGASVTGDAKILCTAEEYAGIYYNDGTTGPGGHIQYAAFRQGCPISAVATAAQSSTAGDPGPCSTDCSGLVSIAVDQAFNQNYLWYVSTTMIDEGPTKGSQYWQSIPISQTQPGDIVTNSHHVAIVISYDAAAGAPVVFQAPQTGQQIGPTSGPDTSDQFTNAYRWTGPGSGST